ncbi:MAG: T9SS type A sorting domain-containing protein, partial [Polaribacter sp.]
NPGADHFSLESIRYKHLAAADVGPNAYEANDGSETLFVSTLTTFSAKIDAKNVTISTNLDWTLVKDADWFSVSANSGSKNTTVTVNVTENKTFTIRQGFITISAGNLTKKIAVNQEAADPRTTFKLINDNSTNDKVTVESVFAEEITATKNNIAAHSLDKDVNTQWSGFGVPGEIIYNLGGSFNLALVDFAATSGKTYEFQVWVSKTGTASSDFTNAFSSAGNLVSNSTGEFKSFLLPTIIADVKYVKIIGYGQPSRPSDWNTIKEIEFYKSESLSINNDQLSKVKIYPNPSNNKLYIDFLEENIKEIKMISLNGKVVLNKQIKNSEKQITIHTHNLANGVYIINLQNEKKAQQFRKIIIHH